MHRVHPTVVGHWPLWESSWHLEKLWEWKKLKFDREKLIIKSNFIHQCISWKSHNTAEKNHWNKGYFEMNKWSEKKNCCLMIIEQLFYNSVVRKKSFSKIFPKSKFQRLTRSDSAKIKMKMKTLYSLFDRPSVTL